MRAASMAGKKPSLSTTFKSTKSGRSATVNKDKPKQQQQRAVQQPASQQASGARS